MLLLASQTALFARYQDIAQEYAQQEKAAGSPSLIKRLSTCATRVSEGFAEYWRVPANDSRIMAEMNLFPKRIML